MPRRKLALLILGTLVWALAACAGEPTQVQPTSAPPTSAPPTSAPTQIVEPVLTQPVDGDLPQTDAEVPRVSLEEARAALDSGAAILVDVRPVPAFASKHIVGAINIPLADIERNPSELILDKEEWIITYCT